MATYSIIRFHFDGENEVIETGLSLEEAQEHCNDDESSSSADGCGPEPGAWFDGYREE